MSLLQQVLIMALILLLGCVLWCAVAHIICSVAEPSEFDRLLDKELERRYKKAAQEEDAENELLRYERDQALAEYQRSKELPETRELVRKNTITRNTK